jgi:hypothetical protein
MELLKICKKGWRMNATENLYIQIYHYQGLLITEQSPGEENPLFSDYHPTSLT